MLRRNKRKPLSSLPYSIEFRTDPPNDPPGPPRAPMTPRRVKRRSTRSKRGSNGQVRYQNPVTRLLDRSLDTSSNDSYAHLGSGGGGLSNPVFLGSRSSLHSLYGKANPNVSAHGRASQQSLRSSRGGGRPPYINSSETVI